jgi:hypothetical protein
MTIKFELATLLAHYESQFKDGDASALLDAANLCLNHGIVAPDWVASAFNAAIEHRWRPGHARTLDAAFDVHRPKNWSQQRARKDAFAKHLFRLVVSHHENGDAIGRALFESVAEEVNAYITVVKFNGTDVQNAYYEVKRLTEIRQKTR